MVYWNDGSEFSFLICPPWLSRDKEIANWSGFQEDLFYYRLHILQNTDMNVNGIYSLFEIMELPTSLHLNLTKVGDRRW